MPQTLLAFVAMMVITSFSMTVQQRSILTQRQDLEREIEEMAGSVAVESMEIIRARAFDQAVVDSTVDGTLNDLNLFSFNNATDHFTPGHACSVFSTGSDTCDDIDDFHAMQTGTVPFQIGANTIKFSVDVEVIYVDDNAVRVDNRTFNKEVTVTVRDIWPDSETQPFMLSPVTLSRVFTYEF